MGYWILADGLLLTMMGFCVEKYIIAHVGGLQPTRESEHPLLGEVIPVQFKQLDQMIFAKISILDFYFYF